MRRLPTAHEIAAIRELLDDLTDEDGCVDYPENLLEDLPSYLELILVLYDELSHYW